MEWILVVFMHGGGVELHDYANEKTKEPIRIEKECTDLRDVRKAELGEWFKEGKCFAVGETGYE